MEAKKYTIGGKEYRLLDRYSLATWGKIIRLINGLPEDEGGALVLMLTSGSLDDFLSLVLDRPVEDELYEEDFKTAMQVIADFFSRKNSLIASIKKHSPASADTTPPPSNSSNLSQT